VNRQTCRNTATKVTHIRAHKIWQWREGVKIHITFPPLSSPSLPLTFDSLCSCPLPCLYVPPLIQIESLGERRKFSGSGRSQAHAHFMASNTQNLIHSKNCKPERNRHTCLPGPQFFLKKIILNGGMHHNATGHSRTIKCDQILSRKEVADQVCHQVAAMEFGP